MSDIDNGAAGQSRAKRPVAEMHITWNPETGDMRYASINLSHYEELALLKLVRRRRKEQLRAAEDAPRAVLPVQRVVASRA